MRPRFAPLLLALLAGCGPKPTPPRPAPEGGPEAGYKPVAMERMAKVGVALHEYHSAFNRFPAGIAGKAGAGLSWRVQLLPYLGQEALYKQFKLDEPWDSEHNAALVPQMPDVFASPATAAPPGRTHLQAFRGPSAFLATTPQGPPVPPGGRINGRVMHAIADGTSTTLIVAEAATPVVWTQPDDLPFDGTAQKQDAAVPKLGGVFADGFHGLMADGRVLFFPKDVTTDGMLRKAITVDGAEPDELEPIFQANGVKR